MSKVRNQSKILDLINLTLSNQGNPIYYEQITVNSTASKLTNLPDDATSALIVVESSISSPTIAIRYREDGKLPVSGLGMPFTDGGAFELKGRQSLINFQVIEESVGTHKLNVTYYK